MSALPFPTVGGISGNKWRGAGQFKYFFPVKLRWQAAGYFHNAASDSHGQAGGEMETAEFRDARRLSESTLAENSNQLANAVCVTIGLLTSTTTMLQIIQHSRLPFNPATAYSKPHCNQRWMVSERSMTKGAKSSPRYVGSLKRFDRSSGGNRVVSERSTSYGAGSRTTFKMTLVVCAMILDAGNDPSQSHTPRRRKYAHPPSPRRSEVPASPVVVAYSSSSSPPDFSSKRAVPDKPQTSRGKERRSNARDAVETDGARPGYNVNKRSQATQGFRV
ncbi:hypothetical protein EDB85DRAFT_1904534 [Lactarius pseudohatsudake]|nr:hypothetical protein EDB85DRAFT_1904534 [Lactarius pseudohatsudake]